MLGNVTKIPWGYEDFWMIYLNGCKNEYCSKWVGCVYEYLGFGN